VLGPAPDKVPDDISAMTGLILMWLLEGYDMDQIEALHFAMITTENLRCAHN
jgi:hypothetical protein